MDSEEKYLVQYEALMKRNDPNKYGDMWLDKTTIKWKRKTGPEGDKQEQTNFNDELAEKRRKKREKNKSRNEYERQFKVNRQIVLVLDNFTCRECGSKENLHVHHTIERRNGGTNDINNLVTLCEKCHAEKHRGEVVYKIMIV